MTRDFGGNGKLGLVGVDEGGGREASGGIREMREKGPLQGG